MLGRRVQRGREAPMDLDVPAAVWASAESGDSVKKPLLKDGVRAQGAQPPVEAAQSMTLSACASAAQLPGVSRPASPGAFLAASTLTALATPSKAHTIPSFEAQPTHRAASAAAQRSVSGVRSSVLGCIFGRRLPLRPAAPVAPAAVVPTSPNTKSRTRRVVGAGSAHGAVVSKPAVRERSEPRTVPVEARRLRTPSYPHWPVVFMGYLQAGFNAVLIAGMLWCLLQFVLTVRRDVEIKVSEQLSVITGEIAHCARQYAENRCEPALRVPAMQQACSAWETCMRRDPSVVGRAKLSAETFAEIVNGLIEPISYKTLVFILAALFGTIFLSNYAFSMARGRAAAAALAAVERASRSSPGSVPLIASAPLRR